MFLFIQEGCKGEYKISLPDPRDGKIFLRSLENPVFLTIFPVIFLMLLNKTSGFTIYVARWRPIYLRDCFLRGCQLVTHYNLLIFLFTMYSFSLAV